MPILLYIHNYKYVYYCLLLIHMTSQAQTLPVHYTYTCQHYNTCCTCLYITYMPILAMYCTCLYVACSWLRPYSTCLYIVIALYYPLLTHSLSRNTRLTKVISSICTLYPQTWCFEIFFVYYNILKPSCVKSV